MLRTLRTFFSGEVLPRISRHVYCVTLQFHSVCISTEISILCGAPFVTSRLFLLLSPLRLQYIAFVKQHYSTSSKCLCDLDSFLHGSMQYFSRTRIGKTDITTVENLVNRKAKMGPSVCFLKAISKSMKHLLSFSSVFILNKNFRFYVFYCFKVWASKRWFSVSYNFTGLSTP